MLSQSEISKLLPCRHIQPRFANSASTLSPGRVQLMARWDSSARRLVGISASVLRLCRRPGPLEHATLAQHAEQVVGRVEPTRAVAAEREDLDPGEIERLTGPFDTWGSMRPENVPVPAHAKPTTEFSRSYIGAPVCAKIKSG
jgi:hypothetical protein